MHIIEHVLGPVEFPGALLLRQKTLAVAPRDFAEVLDPRIQLSLTLLRKNAFSPRFRIKEIAAHLQISSSHLRHLFKKEVGMSPTHYVKLLRLRQAKELLQTTFLSVKQVMATVGFADPSHFVRNYKAQHGETPSETRASNQVRKYPSTRRARNFRL